MRCTDIYFCFMTAKRCQKYPGTLQNLTGNRSRNSDYKPSHTDLVNFDNALLEVDQWNISRWTRVLLCGHTCRVEVDYLSPPPPLTHTMNVPYPPPDVCVCVCVILLHTAAGVFMLQAVFLERASTYKNMQMLLLKRVCLCACECGAAAAGGGVGGGVYHSYCHPCIWGGFMSEWWQQGRILKIY